MVLNILFFALIVFLIYITANYFLNKKNITVKFDRVQKKGRNEDEKLSKEFELTFILKNRTISFIHKNKKITLYLDTASISQTFISKNLHYMFTLDKTMGYKDLYFVTFKDKEDSYFYGIGKLT